MVYEDVTNPQYLFAKYVMIFFTFQSDEKTRAIYDT